jgi:hypothetical protein
MQGHVIRHRCSSGSTLRGWFGTLVVAGDYSESRSERISESQYETIQAAHCKHIATVVVSKPRGAKPFMPLSARLLPAMSFWLGLLLLMRPCLLVNVCLLQVWYTVAWALSRCRPRPVLPDVAPPPSAPSGVLRPKLLWGKAWTPSCFFSLEAIPQHC